MILTLFKNILLSRTFEAIQQSLNDVSLVKNSWPYCCGLNGEANYSQPPVKIHNMKGELDRSLTLKCTNPSLELRDGETPLYSRSEIKAIGHIN